MAVKTPVRGDFNGSGDLTGLSEFQASDFIGVSDGGTGATTVAGARSSLGLVIGTNVQAYDAQLTDVAGLTPTDGGFIVGDGSNFVLETGNTARASLGLGTSDSPSFNGLTLSGDLIINGTTTTINSTVVTVDDPIFTLGGDTAPSSDDNKDRGIEFRYHTGSAAKVGFFGFDDSSGKFTFIPDATNTSEVFSGTAGTIVANLEGNVTGTVSSLSGLDTDDLTEGSSNLYFTNERVDDRVGALLIDSATSGIDINYDDANNQLTISADLSEITTDLNERVDDRVDSLLTAGSNVSLTYDDAAGTLTIASTDTNTQLTTEEVQDIVGGMVDGGTETNVTVTYDDTAGKLNFVVSQLTAEQVQDIIGPMFSSNTETFITVTYDDSDGTLDLVVPVLDEDNMASDSASHLATQQSIKAYVDSQVQTEESIEDFVGGMVTGNTETFITVTYEDSDGTMDFVVPVLDEDNLASDSATHLATQQSIKAYVDATIDSTEEVQDVVGAMFSSNTEQYITVSYDDSDGTIDLVVPVLDEDNMASDSSAHLATQQSIKAYVDSQVQTEESIEDFVGGMLTGNTETLITVTYEDSDGTMDFVVDNDLANYDNTNSGFITATLTQEQVEDFVGGMLGGTETFIAVTYDDTNGNIDFVVPVKDEDNMASDSATHLATQQSIKAYVDSQVTAQDLDFQGDSGGALSIDLDSETLTFTGGTGIDTSGSGNTVTFAIDSTVVTESSTDTLTNKTVNLENNTVIVEYAVTVSSGNFLIDGEANATISFRPGVVHRFDLSDSSVGSHPFKLSTTSDGSHNSGSEYTTGKTANGSQGSSGAYVEYTVNAATPDILYYYCSSHSGMGGTITVFGSAYGDADVQSYLSAGTGITLSGSGVIASSITQYSDSDAQAVSINNVVEDTTPQLGGNLDLNSSNITGTGNIDTSGDITITSTSDTSAAGPIINLVRDSASPADADYLGQIKFKGDDDGGASTVYAKITGKIDDASAGTEDGLIEFATIKNGSSNIAARLKTTNFQLLNGTGLEVAGDATITGNLTVNGTTTTIDTTNTVVSDSLIELANGTSGSPANDAGIVIERGSSDNAFIGYDESEDKFIVGTGSFTGASTGNLTVSTGTLVANLEGNVTGNVTGNVSGSSGSTTGNAATATALATGRTIGMTGDVVWTSASFDGSGDVTGAATIQANAVETGMVNANVISGQSAYSGTVDTTNDFVLIYDHSTTSLKKIAVSDLNSASGAGTMSSFTIAGDSGSNQVVADANTLTLTGGSGIDTSVGGTDEVTIALNTEAVQDIVGAMFSGNTESNITVTYEDSDGTIDLAVTGGGSVSEAFKTIAVSGQNNVVADSATDTLTFAAGSNITLTTNDSTDTITIASTDTNTQLTQEQVEDFVNGVIVAGANITKTYDDAAGTLTIAATGGAANAFSTLAVAGQSNVVADATTDTLTLVAGTGMTLTTDASADSITFASSGGGSGSMPVTLAGGSSDPIVLSQATSIGAIPFTSFDGSTDNINLSGSTQAVTSFTDNDGDTKLEVERSSDNDTVHIKAGGTDVLTATSSGVTISNLTVTGTSTQANEMKITDTLIELNADGTSLGVDAGIVIERGNTGADAAFIWDESSDSFAVGTLSTDGAILFDKADGTSQPLPISSGEVAFNHADGTADNLPITSSSLAFTEADGTSDPITQVSYGPETDMSVKITEATLKAKTQNQSDNSTNVATTAYVDTALGSLSSNSITDADSDTKIQVEEGSDEDIIRADTGGQERLTIDNNVSMAARGGFFTHNLAMHASETFTIASTEGTVAAGPLDIQGTVDVQGSLVVL